MFVVYRVVCNILEGDGRLTEAAECFRQLQNALPWNTVMHDLMHDERVQWECGRWLRPWCNRLLIEIPHLDFRGRCAEKLEKLGDTARDSKKHEEAVGYYSAALLIDPTNVNDILLKRSNEVWTVFRVTSNGPH